MQASERRSTHYMAVTGSSGGFEHDLDLPIAASTDSSRQAG